MAHYFFSFFAISQVLMATWILPTILATRSFNVCLYVYTATASMGQLLRWANSAKIGLYGGHDDNNTRRSKYRVGKIPRLSSKLLFLLHLSCARRILGHSTARYNQFEKCWDTPTKNCCVYLSLRWVTHLCDITLTPCLPSILSCSSKFWEWSRIASNFDMRGGGWGGGVESKYKIIDRLFKPK